MTALSQVKILSKCFDAQRLSSYHVDKNFREATDVSNTSNTRATKGSKFWMQRIANDELLTARLETLLGERNLRWLSPLEAESFKEYQLKEPKIFSDALGLSREEFREKFSFWPTNQPHWDAIAVSADGKILYLFEAKAHVKETFSRISATNPDSVKKISAALRVTFDELSTAGDFTAWTEKFYQLGNRLTFLRFMNRMTLPTIDRVELVLLNVTDDRTFIPTPQKLWARHVEEMFREMSGQTQPPSNVSVIYFSGK